MIVTPPPAHPAHPAHPPRPLRVLTLLLALVPCTAAPRAAATVPQVAERDAAQPAAPAAERQQEELPLQRLLDTPDLLTPKLPRVQWLPGITAWSEVHAAPGGPIVVLQHAQGGRGQPLFTATDLAQALAQARGPPLADDELPEFTWRSRHVLRCVLQNAVWHWDVREEKATRAAVAPATAAHVAFTPDDGAVAYVDEQQLWVQKCDGARRRLTWDGSHDVVYGDGAHRDEFGIHDGLWWDASGRRLAFYREDLRPIDPYPYADVAGLLPKAVSGRYPFAGRAHSKVRVGVYDSADDSVRWLEHDPDADLYWTNVTWSPDGDSLLVALVNRGQDRMDLVRFDAATGARRAVLFSERDREWIEPEHGPKLLPDGSGRFLWRSPRDGFHHLYLYGPDGGEPIRQVTCGAFDVQELLAFTADGRYAFLSASGHDSRQLHLFTCELDKAELVQVTRGRGVHHCQISGEADLLLDTWSSLEQPGAIDLLHTDGSPVRRVATASDPLARFQGGAIERRFFEVAADDGTRLHGALLVPQSRANGGGSDRRFPLLHYVYGGPHVQLVRDEWNGGAGAWLVWMATQGFVVAWLDNRGTPNRGIDFAQAIWRRLSELESDDQLRGLRHLQGLPFVDASRTGVFGWSYGGYMTLNLMLRAPDLYTCGASGAPVTDWRQYETGYTERYMDTPAENPAGYEAASVLPRAKALQGRLLLIQGSDDKTVMFSHTLRFLRACIDAGKLVDYMVYPMQQHGLRGGDKKHLYSLLTRFFREHLQRGPG